MSSSLYAIARIVREEIVWVLQSVYDLRQLVLHPWQNKWVIVGCTGWFIATIYLMNLAGFFNCGHWNLWTGCT